MLNTDNLKQENEGRAKHFICPQSLLKPLHPACRETN